MNMISQLDRLIPFLRSSLSLIIWIELFIGILVAITVSLSAFLIFEHLSAYKNPEEQKFLLGVILMVPCYAIESYLSLVNPAISTYCGILRDGYEAFAMYCFGRYLVACLGGEQRTVEFMEREGISCSSVPLLPDSSGKGIVKHHFPMNYILKPWRLGKGFYQLIKIGIVQYMIIKTFTALSAVILQTFGAYCEGEFRWNCGYPYMAVVLNFSQSWALYCLVQFYTVLKVELAHIKPLAKFLTFKSIVFLTWWQGIAIAVFYSLGLFRSPIAEELQFKISVQDFIICIEMCFASIIHLYVFPSKPYELMGDRFQGTISVLGDYASVDCPIDPDEVRDSERPTKLRLPHPDIDIKSGMTIKESVCDVVLGGGEFIVNDVKFTVSQAVEPIMEKRTQLNEKLKRSKDDSGILKAQTKRIIRGIDDPLLNGSISDSAMVPRGRGHRRKPSYNTAESGGEAAIRELIGVTKLEEGGGLQKTKIIDFSKIEFNNTLDDSCSLHLRIQLYQKNFCNWFCTFASSLEYP